jgi:hypothetical protein
MSNSEEDLQEEAKAAVKIQAVFRGRQSRKKGIGNISSDEDETSDSQSKI